MQKRYTRFVKRADTTIDRALAPGENRVCFICNSKSKIVKQGSAQQRVLFIGQIVYYNVRRGE